MIEEDRITYACTDCGATDCKLWRQYQTFNPSLLCAPCACKDQEKNIEDMDVDGRMPWRFQPSHRIVQVGNLVPAVPTPDWTAYWGFTSVPDEGVTWWRYLPSFPALKLTSYLCEPCQFGGCHRCTGCTCADDNHGIGYRNQEEADARTERTAPMS